MKSKKKNLLALFGVLLIGLLILSSCASQIRVKPIRPYIDPGIRDYEIKTVAVLPFVIPDYLGYTNGGYQVSAAMTNDLVRKLSMLSTYHLVNSTDTTAALNEQVGPITEWIFQGDRQKALTTARALHCDAVIFAQLNTYRQGNLIDSEVDVEVTLMDVFSAATIWSIQEDVRGKSGRQSLGQTPRSPSAQHLANLAVEGVVDKIGKINKDGVNFKVRTVSSKKIVGYSVLATGVATTALTGYFYFEAERSFQEYKDADSPGRADSFKQKTQDFDTLWMVFGGLSVAALGTSAYLLMTDEPYNLSPTLAEDFWLKRFDLGISPQEDGGQVQLKIRF